MYSSPLARPSAVRSTSEPTIVSSSVTTSSRVLALRAASTLTVAVFAPAAFCTVSLKTCLPRSAIRTVTEPLVFWAPAQSPEAITTSARLLCQRSRTLSPTEALVVDATSLTMGGLTVTTGAGARRSRRRGGGGAATVWVSVFEEVSLSRRRCTSR